MHMKNDLNFCLGLFHIVQLDKLCDDNRQDDYGWQKGKAVEGKRPICGSSCSHWNKVWEISVIALGLQSESPRYDTELGRLNFDFWWDAVIINLTSWRWAWYWSKHVKDYNVTYILLYNKGIVHYVGNWNKSILWCTVRKNQSTQAVAPLQQPTG